MKRPDWYLSTVRYLSNYQEHLNIANSLKEEVKSPQPKITFNYSLPLKQSDLSDNTPLSAGIHIDNKLMYQSHKNESYFIDLAVNMLSPEEKFIIYKRFVEGIKDSNVIKLFENRFGIFSDYKYRKLRDRAIYELSYILGYRRADE